jgi:hypothetical protein
MVIFQLNVVHNWSNQLLQKSVDENRLPLLSREVHCHS